MKMPKLFKGKVHPFFGTTLEEQLEFDILRYSCVSSSIPVILREFLIFFDDIVLQTEGIFRTTASKKSVTLLRQKIETSMNFS
jgi:hypothetical protein